MKFKPFVPAQELLSKFIFFTGKGGVGKTSCACATAISLANSGKKVYLVSTDPASNLQDVFKCELSNKGDAISEVPNLMVANLDPMLAAKEYRDKVIEPYRALLPQDVIENMQEQLSGSCTVEIAAFNEFSHFLTASDVINSYDHIIFDTAPTGHTLRMLELPSAWHSFIETNKNGASCLGQLSGLLEHKSMYENALKNLSNPKLTTLVLVSRAETAALNEANRAATELQELNLNNQVLILNGLLPEVITALKTAQGAQGALDARAQLENSTDALALSLINKQLSALEHMPSALACLPTYAISMLPMSLNSIANIEHMLEATPLKQLSSASKDDKKVHLASSKLDDLVAEIIAHGRKIIFTMGKGGVGKTTMASAIAMKLAARGLDVHLTTTDPAAHLKFVVKEQEHLSVSVLDEKEALKSYAAEVIASAQANGLSEQDLEYIKEDLRSPCTKEIAVFKAFAQLVESCKDRIMVIDTAPTGHTLLLLSSTQSYDKEISRNKGESSSAVKNLLPRLTSEETEVIIVTLAEATPYLEAKRLEEDLERAHINVKWWLINSSLLNTDTQHELLQAKAKHELKWAQTILEHTKGKSALISLQPYDVTFDHLLDL